MGNLIETDLSLQGWSVNGQFKSVFGFSIAQALSNDLDVKFGGFRKKTVLELQKYLEVNRFLARYYMEAPDFASLLPPDWDDTSWALMAIAPQLDHNLPANVVHALTLSEVNVGGPYYTWMSYDSSNENDIDILVNIAIYRMLLRFGIKHDYLVEWCIENIECHSKYYPLEVEFLMKTLLVVDLRKYYPNDSTVQKFVNEMSRVYIDYLMRIPKWSGWQVVSYWYLMKHTDWYIDSMRISDNWDDGLDTVCYGFSSDGSRATDHFPIVKSFLSDLVYAIQNRYIGQSSKESNSTPQFSLKDDSIRYNDLYLRALSRAKSYFMRYFNLSYEDFPHKLWYIFQSFHMTYEGFLLPYWLQEKLDLKYPDSDLSDMSVYNLFLWFILWLINGVTDGDFSISENLFTELQAYLQKYYPELELSDRVSYLGLSIRLSPYYNRIVAYTYLKYPDKSLALDRIVSGLDRYLIAHQINDDLHDLWDDLDSSTDTWITEFYHFTMGQKAKNVDILKDIYSPIIRILKHHIRIADQILGDKFLPIQRLKAAMSHWDQFYSEFMSLKAETDIDNTRVHD